jgi:hypothetical protein
MVEVWGWKDMVVFQLEHGILTDATAVGFNPVRVASAMEKFGVV